MQISEEMVEVVERFIADKKPGRVTTPGEIREMLQHVVALGWLTLPAIPALDLELSKEEDAAIRDVITRQRRAYKTAIAALHDAKGDVQAQVAALSAELADAKQHVAELEEQLSFLPRPCFIEEVDGELAIHNGKAAVLRIREVVLGPSSSGRGNAG